MRDPLLNPKLKLGENERSLLNPKLKLGENERRLKFSSLDVRA